MAKEAFNPSRCEIKKAELIPHVKENIKSSIKIYEPRCEVIDVKVSGNIDSNEIAVKIIFRVINSNRDSSLTIDLSRVR